MAVTELGDRGTSMPSGYSTYVGGAKKPNVPPPFEGLDDLFIRRVGQGMSTGICSATQPASSDTGP